MVTCNNRVISILSLGQEGSQVEQHSLYLAGLRGWPNIEVPLLSLRPKTEQGKDRGCGGQAQRCKFVAAHT